eukprot:scaffold63612_cov32-Tisochrysis_lutea.AAC.3
MAQHPSRQPASSHCASSCVSHRPNARRIASFTTPAPPFGSSRVANSSRSSAGRCSLTQRAHSAPPCPSNTA